MGRALEPRTPHPGGNIPDLWPAGAPHAVGTTGARKVAGPTLQAGTALWEGPAGGGQGMSSMQTRKAQPEEQGQPAAAGLVRCKSS